MASPEALAPPADELDVSSLPQPTATTASTAAANASALRPAERCPRMGRFMKLQPPQV